MADSTDLFTITETSISWWLNQSLTSNLTCMDLQLFMLWTECTWIYYHFPTDILCTDKRQCWKWLAAGIVIIFCGENFEKNERCKNIQNANSMNKTNKTYLNSFRFIETSHWRFQAKLIMIPRVGSLGKSMDYCYSFTVCKCREKTNEGKRERRKDMHTIYRIHFMWKCICQILKIYFFLPYLLYIYLKVCQNGAFICFRFACFSSTDA